MKNRSTNLEKLKQHEEYRQLGQDNNLSGDTYAPASPAYTNGANTDKLAQLAQDFQVAHEALTQRKAEFQALYSRSVAEVVKLGIILIEAKKLSDRKWLKWLGQNTSISRKTAQRWMAVARNSSAVSHLTPTSKKLTEHYHDLGILKKKSKKSEPNAGQPTPDAPAEKGEDSEKSDDPNKALFVKAKDLSDRLAQLAYQTDNQKGMAESLKSIIAWYEGYLALKKKAEEKAEQDAEFEKEFLLTA
jgi:hypothetical protein